MTTAPANSETGSEPTAREAWQTIRDNGDIQYAPVEIPPPDPPPEWAVWLNEMLSRFFSFLGDLLSPVAQLFGGSWYIVKWVLLALAITGLLYLVWRLVEPMLGIERKPSETASEEWVPDQAQAVALLEEADALAAAGKYDEATHLLLQRSVHQIATARPDWLEPSSTAREIALIPALSDTARGAFSTIATRVERSLFALRPLSAEDWTTAREAYSSFAITDLTLSNAGVA